MGLPSTPPTRQIRLPSTTGERSPRRSRSTSAGSCHLFARSRAAQLQCILPRVMTSITPSRPYSDTGWRRKLLRPASCREFQFVSKIRRPAQCVIGPMCDRQTMRAEIPVQRHFRGTSASTPFDAMVPEQKQQRPIKSWRGPLR